MCIVLGKNKWNKNTHTCTHTSPPHFHVQCLTGAMSVFVSWWKGSGWCCIVFHVQCLTGGMSVCVSWWKGSGRVSCRSWGRNRSESIMTGFTVSTKTHRLPTHPPMCECSPCFWAFLQQSEKLDDTPPPCSGKPDERPPPWKTTRLEDHSHWRPPH